MRASLSRLRASSPFTISSSPSSPSSPVAHASVFGWVGASDKHVQKYAALFHSLGVPHVQRTTAPLFDCFFAPWRLQRLAQAWLESLAAPGLAGRPGVALLLSNGGTFVYLEALKLLAKDAALPAGARRFASVRLCAVLFDSAPARVTATSAARALAGSIRSPRVRAAAEAAARLLLATAPLLLRAEERNAALWGALACDRAVKVHAYVSSATDPITDAAWVAELVAARLAAGHKTRAWVLEDSPHCGHLARAPEAYRAWAERALRAGTAAGGSDAKQS
jgi:hypothetical protein